jgi:predicted phage tail protein
MVETEDGSIDQTDLIVPICKGDVTISLVPAGSKSGIGKILAAIAIVIIIMYNPGLFAAVGAEGAVATNFALGLNTYGAIAASMAINLAMTGIQQLMAPDPAVDQDAPTNYLFSGGANNAVEGDPVPILYGELRVPGRPIAVDILQGGNGSNGNMFDQDVINNTATDSANNVNIVSSKQQN